MANTLLNVSDITREFLRILHTKLNFINAITRQYDDSFAKSGGKIGDSLKIRKPVQYTVRTGATLSTQDTTEEQVTLTVATMKGVDIKFSSSELTLNIDDFSNRYLKPAGLRLAAEMEKDGLALYKDVYNHVGTPGTTPATALVFLEAGQKLDETITPRDNDRKAIVNPAANASMIDALKGLYHDQKALEDQYLKGILVPSLGVNWSISPIVNSHTTGTRDNTTPLVNGATQTGASLICDGFDVNVTITQGDVFTLAGVYAINPETKQQYSNLQQFVVTAAATASGTGTVTLSISPSITVSGATQTVSGSPADNAALTFVGAASTIYPQNLVFHKEAFTMATADLEVPKGVDFARSENYDGIAMRVVRQYDINTDNFPCRFDVLYGYKCIQPGFAVRVTG